MILTSLLAATVLGAVLYGFLIAAGARSMSLRVLLPLCMVLILASLSLFYVMPPDQGQGAGRILLALTLLWLGWILLMAGLARITIPRVADLGGIVVLAGGLGAMAPLAGFGLARVLA
ncbi:hypothetical protein [Pseudooceanicola aestuarii]|uniref:hypothetical protein n=1 Tax=Pseudooceanicola aestuarii TaxID=2697319 RepID=UPI0013D01755|nr:hypothetical protein [Pseudooceanicola aestuarii]